MSMCCLFRGPGTKVPTRDKIVVDGVALDVSPIDRAELELPERVLGAYHLAGSLRSPDSVLHDSNGWLGAIQQEVASRFGERHWVEVRCDHARQRSAGYLERMTTATGDVERMMSWLFAAGVTTHIMLTAALRNPTVRNRYPATRAMLRELGHTDMYEPLIDLLDPGKTSARKATTYVGILGPLFDRAMRSRRTWFHFADDISPAGRIGAIDGSAKLIQDGLPREAMFWIGVTTARCMAILECDDPGGQTEFAGMFRDLAGQLRIGTADEGAARATEFQRVLPTIRQNAQLLIDERSEIETVRS